MNRDEYATFLYYFGERKQSKAEQAEAIPEVMAFLDYIEIAKALYPLGDEFRKVGLGFPDVSSYQPIIDHFGTVAVQIDDTDYTGDSRILYIDSGNGFGYLNFGWGSCSGCDSLQACSSYVELGKLIGELESSIKWASKVDMLKFFKEHDWQGDYNYGDEQKQFIEKSIVYLEN